MTAGKAHGVNREYQEHCRDFLIRMNPGFQPYSGDGCDVAFDVGGTTWTIDVAVRNDEGELMVAECRRRETAAKQSEVATLAYHVELLRRAFDVPVSGAFLAKTDPQLGAVKVGTYEGITVAVLPEPGIEQPRFPLAFHRYDPEREQRLKDYLFYALHAKVEARGGSVELNHNRTLHAEGARIGASGGNATLTVTRRDGSKTSR